MSNQSKLVTVFGGSGFLGRYVVRALAARGYRVKVAVRRPDLAYFLQPLGEVGQIWPIQANLRYRKSVEEAVDGADVVVNLVAILRPSGKQNYTSVNVSGARTIAEVAREQDARLVHVSAIGANPDSPSRYGRSKGEAEEAVLETVKRAVILRPSFIFGQEDEFFNRFAAIARVSPILPLIGGKTLMQPVYVGDVAEAVARAVDGELAGGKVYELGGPDVMTFRDAMQQMMKIINRNRSILSIPMFIGRGMAGLTGWLPGAPITSDEFTMLAQGNVVSQEAIKQKRTLEGMGINPHNLEAILPTYLVQYRPEGQFTRPGTA